jgi:hypothetical protein
MKNRILSITRNTIPYVGILRGLDLVKSVTDCLLMQQLDYWFAKYPDGFYKFLSPCDHALYKDGDSWTEELFLSDKEFRTAFEHLGTVYKSKSDFIKQDDPFQGRYYCSYYDRITKKTYYFRNHQKVDNELEILIATSDNQKNEEKLKAPAHKSVNDQWSDKENTNGQFYSIDTEIKTNINSENIQRVGEAPTPKNDFCENFLEEKSEPQVSVATETKVVVEKPELKNVSGGGTSASGDSGWSKFEWLDELYRFEKPSRWTSTWFPKTQKLLKSLNTIVNQLGGDIYEVKQMITKAFKRVDSNPSLWGVNLDWVLNADNVMQLAWEYDNAVFAPARKTVENMKQNHETRSRISAALDEFR